MSASVAMPPMDGLRELTTDDQTRIVERLVAAGILPLDVLHPPDGSTPDLQPWMTFSLVVDLVCFYCLSHY